VTQAFCLALVTMEVTMEVEVGGASEWHPGSSAYVKSRKLSLQAHGPPGRMDWLE